MKLAYSILLTLLCSGTLLFGQTKVNKPMHFGFKTSGLSELEVVNRSGDVIIEEWPYDSISIRIEVRTDITNPEKLQSLEQNIRFDVRRSSNFVIARTIFSPYTYNNIFNDLISKTPFGGKNTLNINYHIKSPKTTRITVENTEGNIYLDNLSDGISVTLSEGNFKAINIGRNARLKIKLGEIDLRSIADARIEAEYATLNAQSSQNCMLQSLSSKINIQSATGLSLESKRDKLFFGNLTDANLNNVFSIMQANKVTGRLNANIKYGSLTTTGGYANGTYMAIEAKYAEINIGGPAQIGTKISTTSTDLAYNNSLAVWDITHETIKKSTIVKYFGTYGKGEPRIELSGNFSICSLRFR